MATLTTHRSVQFFLRTHSFKHSFKPIFVKHFFVRLNRRGIIPDMSETLAVIILVAVTIISSVDGKYIEGVLKTRDVGVRRRNFYKFLVEFRFFL